jgi:hypothetical protein
VEEIFELVIGGKRFGELGAEEKNEVSGSWGDGGGKKDGVEDSVEVSGKFRGLVGEGT